MSELILTDQVLRQLSIRRQQRYAYMAGLSSLTYHHYPDDFVRLDRVIDMPTPTRPVFGFQLATTNLLGFPASLGWPLIDYIEPSVELATLAIRLGDQSTYQLVTAEDAWQRYRVTVDMLTGLTLELVESVVRMATADWQSDLRRTPGKLAADLSQRIEWLRCDSIAQIMRDIAQP